MGQDKGNDKKVTNEKPISLHGVDFKEMMKAFLKIKPEGNKANRKESSK